MNKKVYIKPELEVSEFTSDILMQTTSIPLNNDTEVNTEDGQLGHGRRGSWGNLWNESE